MSTKTPSQDYRILEISSEVCWDFFLSHQERVYGETNTTLLSRSDIPKEAKNCFYWGVFLGDEMCGWQLSTHVANFEMLRMNNTALLPEHRGKGLYKKLLKVVIEKAVSLKVKNITSAHHPSNLSVLIPKLSAGFVPTGMHVNTNNGVLIGLTYFIDSQEREMFDVRTGYRKPSVD